MPRVISIFLGVCLCTAASAFESRLFFDFESEVTQHLELRDASITRDPNLVLAGTGSVVADFTKADGSWHEFLHTRPAVSFGEGSTYAVRFQYRILANPDPEIEFYSQLRSRSGKGDIQGDNWLWRQPEGHVGHINRLFRIPDNGGYYLIIGVRNRGAIVIDDLEIREARPNPGALDKRLDTFGSPLSERREGVERMRRHIKRVLDDVLIVTLNEGAGSKPHERKDQIVEDLQPDFIDWNVIGPLAKEYGIRSSSGGCEYQEYYRVEPNDLPKEEREQIWENRYRLFGDSGFVITLENTILSNEAWGEGGYFTCHNGPNWHRHFVQSLTRIARKYTAITQDNIACSVFNRVKGCFCQGCQSRFRDVLKERWSPEELNAVGIDDLDAFSIQQYVVDHGLLERAALEDAVVREYIKFHYVSGLFAWADCVAQAKAVALQQRRPLPCGGNQINAWGTWPYAVAISQFCDFVEIEELVGVTNEVKPRTLQYKLGLASGHHDKPVWVRGPVEDKRAGKGPELSTSYWTVHLAEALANGGIRSFSLGLNTAYTGEAGVPDYMDDVELYQLYKDFAAWMRDHRPLLTHRESQARVGLVYSLPTLMFRRFDTLSTPDDHRLPKFENTARLLDRHHIPYDCVVFGHPEIWDDGPTFDRIRERYDVLILRGVDTLTDEQAALLRELAGKGVRILADEPFERDENLNVRGAVVEIPGILKATDEQIVQCGLEASIVVTDAPEHVTVNAWQSCRGSSLDVHLLNYDADVVGERMNAVESVRVQVRLPETLKVTRCLLSQYGQEDREIEFERTGDTARVTIPTLEAYAILSFTDDRAFDIAKRAAERRIEMDRKQVRKIAHEHDLY